ncbi:MAG: DUF47 family protein [Alphaproteobacteria bacterium]
MAFGKQISLFQRTHEVEKELDEFLDKLSQSALVFKQALHAYLRDGATQDFEIKKDQVSELESRADNLRRSVERALYAQTLIPDARGDVLGLIENLDFILNKIEGVLWHFSIETPEIPEEFREDFTDLTDQVVSSVEAIVLSARAFFRNIETIGDHMHKVMFFEKEADVVSTKLKRAIFATDLPLSNKAHLRDFVELIDDIADHAEDVADRLAIYAIKRTI